MILMITITVVIAIEIIRMTQFARTRRGAHPQLHVARRAVEQQDPEGRHDRISFISFFPLVLFYLLYPFYTIILLSRTTSCRRAARPNLVLSLSFVFS